jgi:hypothetical protein
MADDDARGRVEHAMLAVAETLPAKIVWADGVVLDLGGKGPSVAPHDGLMARVVMLLAAVRELLNETAVGR